MGVHCCVLCVPNAFLPHFRFMFISSRSNASLTEVINGTQSIALIDRYDRIHKFELKLNLKCGSYNLTAEKAPDNRPQSVVSVVWTETQFSKYSVHFAKSGLLTARLTIDCLKIPVSKKLKFRFKLNLKFIWSHSWLWHFLHSKCPCCTTMFQSFGIQWCHKVVRVNTTPWRRSGEWAFSSTHS
jgi:hypothetical protein